MGQSSKLVATTSCCAGAGVTRPSIACSCASRNRRRLPSRPPPEVCIAAGGTMSAAAHSYVIAPPPQAAIAIAGTDKMFPVRRIWCVGRNYEEHIREMGQDVRDPPFFFVTPADAVVPDGAHVTFHPLSKDKLDDVETAVSLL